MKKGFVYFDVGGVAITDFSSNNGWQDLKRSLSNRPTIEEEFDTWWKTIEDPVHIGGIKLDDMVPDLIKTLELSIEKDFSLMNAFISRFETNEDLWPIINLIEKEMPIGLLTNMYTDMFSEISKANLLPNNEWFTVVDSSIEKVRKPDLAIYELAQKRANTDPKDIMFIDNLKENLIVPKQLGWTTFLYDPSNHKGSCKKLLIAYEEFKKKL